MDVFVADQAFPPPPPTVAGGPIPLDAFVIAQPPLVPSPSLGVPTVAAPAFNVANQDLASPNTVDVIITESGTYQTAGPIAQIPFTISRVDAFDVGLPSERYKLTLGVVNLFNLGVDLTNLLVTFVESISQQLPISAPGAALPPTVYNPTRPIVSFDTNSVLVYALDQFGYMLGGTRANPYTALTQPTAGQHLSIGVQRNGPAAINDTNLASPINVNPSLGPPPVPGVPNVYL